MLKLLTTTNLIHENKTKCGEIYCHSYLELTICCTFCDMKLFAYDDFLLHLQNVHFDNNLLQTDAVMQDCKQTSEDENNIKLFQPNEPENNVDERNVSFDDDLDYIIDNSYSSSEEEEESSFVIRKIEKDNFNNQTTESLNRIIKPLSSYGDRSMKNTTATECFSCPECKEKFPHKKDLDIHVYSLHNGYKCDLCDKRFRLTHHLKRHIGAHTAVKKFPCSVENCGRSFSAEQYLKLHLEVHSAEKTFVCDFKNCGKAFQTERRLLAHNYTHIGPKKLICDACGYTCRANLTLLIHQRVHTGEKPFACEVCQKCFVSKTALNQHMTTHSETRPHVCQICNATFASYRVMQRHLLIHSDEKKFKCKFCDSSFKQPNGLDGHVRRMHKAPKLLEITNN